MTDHRDAITGKYVTAEHAKTNPDTTVSETRIRIEPVELHATYGVILSGTPSDPAKLTRATGNPDTTVSESPCAECERLRGVMEALAAKLDAVRAWIDRRGVNVGDRDDDYMRGYRDAQRHALLDAHDLRRTLDATPGGES